MEYRQGTRCVHAGRSTTPVTLGVTTPIVTATAFCCETAEQVVYPRYFNVSTQQVVASRIAELEGGEQGLVLASGMAAIGSILLGLLQHGDHGLFHGGVYGGTHRLVTQRLPRCGIDVSLVRETAVDVFAAQLQENTRLIFFESPTNPLLRVIDIRGIVELARQRGIVTVMDNTFATPINQNPLELGIDVVVHSGTKYLNGHSDVNCGAIVTSAAMMERILPCAIDLGATLDVRGCYLLERGLKTLALRVARQNENAARLAELLRQHRRVRAVHYPGLTDHPEHAVAARQMTGFGGMLSCELDADEQMAKELMRGLQIAQLAVSLGGVETLLCFPKETSHARLTPAERHEQGIADSLVRISVGIEDPRDLCADFQQALG